jgi:Putative transmembrane protein (PGPGW)
MYEKAKHFTLTRPRFKKTVGWVCVVFGGIALVMPVIPGAPLIFVGFELLGLRFLFVDRLLKRNPESLPAATLDA